jgi:hypothetical protein
MTWAIFPRVTKSVTSVDKASLQRVVASEEASFL